MTGSSAPSSPGPVDARAALLLGTGVALTASATLSGLLLPEIERGLDHARALTAWALCLAVGAWLVRRVPASPRATWCVAALTVLGAVFTRAQLPQTHASLLDALLVPDDAASTLSVAARAAWLAAPVALPLGWLSARTLSSSGKRGVLVWWLGITLGVALAPWLQHALLGVDASLLLGAACALPAAWLLSERPRGHASGPRLSRAAALELLLLGAALVLMTRRLPAHVGFGELNLALWLAVVAFGAALAQALPLRWLPRELLLPAALVAPALFADATLLRRAPVSDLPADVLRLALMALPLGLAIGRSARPVARGLPWMLAPLLLVLPGAVLPRLAFPRLSIESLALGLGLLSLGVLLLRRPRARPLPLSIGLTLAVAAYLVDVTPAGGSEAAHGPARQRLGGSLQASASLDGALAYDGALERPWSEARARRLVHLPALLAGAPQRALLASADRGANVATLRAHGLREVDWVRPMHAPLDEPAPEGVQTWVRSERLVLAQDTAPYDLILLLPDPRVRQRLSRIVSVEFYASARARLRPGGRLCQWWDLARVSLDELRAAFASASEAFEHVTLLIENPRARRPLVALMAGDTPLTWNAAIASERFANPAHGAREDFECIGIDADTLPALLQHDTEQLRLLAPAQLASHDALPRLGLRAALGRESADETALAGLAFSTATPVDPLRWVIAPTDATDALATQLRRVRRGWRLLHEAALTSLRVRGVAAPDVDEEPPGSGLFEEAEALARVLAVLPEWDFAVEQLVEWSRAWRRDGRHDLAETLLRRAREARPVPSVELDVALSELLEERGRDGEARELARAAAERHPEHPGPRAVLKRLRAHR